MIFLTTFSCSGNCSATAALAASNKALFLADLSSLARTEETSSFNGASTTANTAFSNSGSIALTGISLFVTETAAKSSI